MVSLPEILVTQKAPAYGFIQVRFETDDDSGHLLADFEPNNGEFKIQTFGVSTPRIGLGKELLRRAEVEALRLNASRMVATIISPECLASMRDVFGEASIRVEQEGDFGQFGGTKAQLVHYIEEPYL